MRISDWSSDVCSSDLLWRIPASRMKGDLDRKDEINGDHLVPMTRQGLAVLRALWPLTGEGELLFPSNRHSHRPMSENAIGYLLNRAGYHGHHVPHGFRAAFRSEEHTSELQSLMRISYAVFCLKKKKHSRYK